MATSDAQAAAVAAAMPSVLAERSRDAFERMLAADVRWGGPEDTEQTCRDRRQAGDFYAGLLAADVQLEVLEVSVHDSQVLARLRITRPQGAPDGPARHGCCSPSKTVWSLTSGTSKTTAPILQ